MEKDAVTPIGVLFVCTGNQCRSPMAAGLLQHRLAERGETVVVDSAGFLGGGVAPPRHAVESMSDIGIDISGHGSRSVDPALISASEVVIGMTRQHVVGLSEMAPRSWERCFTFRDLLQRAVSVGPRRPQEPIAAWSGRLHAGRSLADLANLPLSDDVSDPVGGSRRDFDATREVLDRMTSELADLLRSA
jgi:protein-tyrosine phosphatase